MGGLFVDSLVLSIARGVRRQARRSAAGKWPLVDGRITRFQVRDEAWNDFRPVVDFSYEAGGETWYGSATGMPMNRRSVDAVGEAVDALGVLRVRYDPEDAHRNRVLNDDNPRLPFEVDLNEGV